MQRKLSPIGMKKERLLSRDELKTVAGMGPKTFEQCAGFLKIPESENPLDNTWVHPENYSVAEQIYGYIKSRGAGEKQDLPGELKKELQEKYAVSRQTIDDIIEELNKPNRDPRDGYPKPLMQKGVVTFEDLKEGMKVSGKIKNVVDFGAFVDIGIKETALLHISEISDTYVSDPMEVLKVGDIKEFTIIGLDLDRRRISLSLKSGAGKSSAPKGSGKVVVKVKAGESGASGSGPGKSAFRKPEKKNGFRDRGNGYSGGSRDDDGTMYNPFAALLKK